MYQYFKTSLAVASYYGAMESGDHFKNGANPKSLMIREKKSLMNYGL